MLRTRALFTRPALRLFHSTTPCLQQQPVPQQQQAPTSSKEEMKPLIAMVENSPSTHKGAAATEAEDPHEIFEAWKVCSFYSPLAFLRSRRIRPPPRRNFPAVGPGAAEAAHHDVFRQLDIDPVYEANNQVLLSNFLTTMGRIRPRAITRLSWRSQRKVTQAIKRSKQKGVLPITYRPRFYVPRISIIPTDNDRT